MGKRHEAIGIKQAIRFEWMQKAANLLLAGLLLNNPAFFPFLLPVMTGDLVSQRCDRIDVVRYGLDDELLKLKGN